MTKPVYIDPGATVVLAEPSTCLRCGQQFTVYRPGDPGHCVKCHDERTARAAELFLRAFRHGIADPGGASACPSCRRKR